MYQRDRIYSAFAAYNRTFSSLNLPEASVSSIPAPEDTTKKSRFPVAKTSIETYEDLYKNSPADLKTPENVRSVFEYDPVTQCYVVRTKVGDMEVSTPFMLTPEEYKDYSLRKSIEAYYREKNKENAGKGKDPFDILDMKFNLGPLEKDFRYSIGVCPITCRKAVANLLGLSYPTAPAISAIPFLESCRSIVAATFIR